MKFVGKASNSGAGAVGGGRRTKQGNTPFGSSFLSNRVLESAIFMVQSTQVQNI